MAGTGPQVLRFQNGAPTRRQFGEKLRFVVKDGAQKNFCYCLIGQKITIGRDPACEIVLEDAKVSRRHLELEWNAATYTARDLATPNHFLVNGKKVSLSALNPGDSLVVGLTVIEVQSIDADGKKILGAILSDGTNTKAADPQIARRRVIVGALLLLLLVLIFSEPSGPVKTFRERAKIDISAETQNKKISKTDAKTALLEVGSGFKLGESDRDADKFFRSGVRELQNKNFRRALTNFDSSLSLEPEHEMAKVYKELAKREFEKEINSATQAAIRARKALRYSEAKMHYQTVLQYLEGDKDNVQFVEAQDALKLLEKMEHEKP